MEIKSHNIIRNLYLYLASIIGLITFIIGSVGLIDNVVKNYVFKVDTGYYSPIDQCGKHYYGDGVSIAPIAAPAAPERLTRTLEEITECENKAKEQKEEYRRNEIGRNFSIAIAEMAVGLPVWLFHFSIIQRESKRNKLNKE